MHPSGGDTDRASNGAHREPKPGQEPRAYDEFARSVVDGLSAQVTVIEESGAIVFVNEAWRVFARDNGATRRRSLKERTTWRPATRLRVQTPRRPPPSRRE